MQAGPSTLGLNMLAGPRTSGSAAKEAEAGSVLRRSHFHRPDRCASSPTPNTVGSRSLVSLWGQKVWCHCGDRRFGVTVGTEDLVSLWGQKIWCHCGDRRFGVTVGTEGLVSLWGQKIWCHCGDRRFGVTVGTEGLVSLWGQKIWCHCEDRRFGVTVGTEDGKAGVNIKDTHPRGWPREKPPNPQNNPIHDSNVSSEPLCVHACKPSP